MSRQLFLLSYFLLVDPPDFFLFFLKKNVTNNNKNNDLFEKPKTHKPKTKYLRSKTKNTFFLFQGTVTNDQKKMLPIRNWILNFVVVLVFGLSGCVFWVREGDVGIQYVFGSLTNTTFAAGCHIDSYWFFGRISHVNVRPQTDQVTNVACGTADGLSLVIESIDIGNSLSEHHVLNTIRKYGENYDTYLVKDKIRHQTQVICANMTSHEVFNTRFHEIDDLLQNFLVLVNQELNSGLSIDFVRLSKPVIPLAIRVQYEQLAEEKTKLKVETERQDRLKKEAETKQMLLEKELKRELDKSHMDLQIAAEKSQNENQIEMQRILAKEENGKVENRIKTAKDQVEANAQRLHAASLDELYAVAGYKEQLLAQHFATAIGPQAKFFFGSIPNFLPFTLFSNTSAF